MSTPEAIERALSREGLLMSPAEARDVRWERTDSHPLPIHYSFPTPAQQIRAYLLDSLYVALTHPERLIALRALVQASGYAGRIGHDVLSGDALIAARNRVENWLTPHADEHYLAVTWWYGQVSQALGFDPVHQSLKGTVGYRP